MRKILLIGAFALAACSGTTPVDEGGGDEPVLTTLAVEATDSSLVVEQTATLSAKGRDQNGKAIGLPSDPIYSVSPTSVATVSGNVLTGVNKGTATVTAAVGSVTGTLQVGVSGRIHNADITASETWAAADNPHVVKGVIGVEGAATPTVTIEAGVEVRFAASAGLEIGGSSASGMLTVNGTAAAPVKFTANAATPAKGHWIGLIFNAPASDNSKVSNATLEFCGGGTSSAAACLTIADSKPVVENVTVLNSAGYGVVVDVGGEFGAGSTKLSVSSSGKHAVRIESGQAGTLPTGGSFTNNTPNAIELRAHWGFVTTTQTWPNLGVPYVVTDDLRVAGSGTPVLTLPAGVELRFGSGRIMEVGSPVNADAGGLLVQGTMTAPVKFTADAATPAKGHWAGVTFNAPASDASKIANATLEFCGGGTSSSAACLTILSSKPVIENVGVQNSAGYGVVVDNVDGAFGAGSTNLSVSGSGKHAVRIESAHAGTLPTGGSFTNNTPNAVELRAHWAFVTTSQTWPNLGVPYVVNGGLRVEGPNTPALTIPAGVELRFGSGMYLNVGASGNSNTGLLKVEGTAAAPVKFTADAATPAAGHWVGLLFIKASSQSRVDYAIVEYAGGDSYVNDGNVVVLEDIGGFITNSTIRNSATCGIQRIAAGFTTDFTAASLGNSFAANAGGNQCGPQ